MLAVGFSACWPQPFYSFFSDFLGNILFIFDFAVQMYVSEACSFIAGESDVSMKLLRLSLSRSS